MLRSARFSPLLRPLVLTFPALLSACLSACAPAPTQGGVGRQLEANAPTTLRAAFDDEGVAWVLGGQACVDRFPFGQPTCPRLAGVSDVAWAGNDAWAALPGPGLVVTLDRAPRSLPVGAVTVLSSRHIYREDGSTADYAGGRGRGVAGRPAAAMTGGDGQDYVVLGGQLRRVSDGAVLSRDAQPYLYATPTGAATSSVPTVSDGLNEYRLTGGFLERFAAGQVLARVPHSPGRVGLVRGDIVTIDERGVIRRFSPSLELLR